MILTTSLIQGQLDCRRSSRRRDSLIRGGSGVKLKLWAVSVKTEVAKEYMDVIGLQKVSVQAPSIPVIPVLEVFTTTASETHGAISSC